MISAIIFSLVYNILKYYKYEYFLDQPNAEQFGTQQYISVWLVLSCPFDMSVSRDHFEVITTPEHKGNVIHVSQCYSDF